MDMNNPFRNAPLENPLFRAYLLCLPELLKDGNEGKNALFGSEKPKPDMIGTRSETINEGYQRYERRLFLAQKIERDFLPPNKVARTCFIYLPPLIREAIPLEWFY